MMYKVEDVLFEMVELGMIQSEVYYDAICEKKFETICDIAEEYAEDIMADFVVLNLSGSIYEKEAIQKMIAEYRKQIDDESEDDKIEMTAYEIMVRSMRNFVII